MKPQTPLAARPPGFEPDRGEVMNPVAEAMPLEIVPGVIFRPLVGRHNGARNLTTGIVALAPGAMLFEDEGVTIFAKCEFLNPSGSIKDRIAAFIIGDW